jgi:hypothetical protein
MQKHMHGGVVTDTNVFALRAFSNCWVCEGWAEYRFTFTPGVSDNQPIHDPYVPINLHLEVDNFKPDLMLPSKTNSNVYECYRMLPPGAHRYYFTVGKELKVANE